MEEIKVKILPLADRRHYMMQYVDPITGKRVSKSTGVLVTEKKASRDEALSVAAKWEADLHAGRYHAPNRITWDDFRERYETEVLASLAENTLRKAGSVFNSIESILSPKRLRDLTADRLSHFQSKLRESGLAETTIEGHCAYVKAAMAWAVSLGMLAAVPKIKRPKRAKSSKVMKGRPITGEEFERMLAKVEAGLMATKPKKNRQATKHPRSAEWISKLTAARRAHVAKIAPSWRHYLRGLWLSGLRLEESLELYWDRDDKLCVDLTGKRPMLRIPAALEKGNQDRVLAMSPEFAEFLLQTPQDERHGPVFNPQALHVFGERPHPQTVGKAVSAIGRAASVKVNTVTTAGVESVKYASAHDLRRSFGERWASRVMPQVLMELMRHENIETTMRYYVGRNAQKTADVLWDAHESVSNTFSNTGGFANQTAPSAESLSSDGLRS